MCAIVAVAAHSQPPCKLLQGSGEEDTAVSRTSVSGGTMVFDRPSFKMNQLLVAAKEKKNNL